MNNQKGGGIPPIAWPIAALVALAVEAGRRLKRTIKRKKRQKRVNNSPVIRTKSFAVKKTNASLVPVSNEELSKKYKLSDSELREFKSFMSTAAGQALQAALTVKGSAELLKCNIPISELYKINGNPDQLRAFVLKDGKFDQQAILSPAGLKTMAPLLVFQCMAVVTSQYYQQIITERLDEVNEKLDLLIHFLEAKDQAKMKSCYNIIAELYKKDSYDIADKIRANGCYDDLCALLEQYRTLVKDITLSKLEIGYRDSNYKEAYAKVKKLEESQYFTDLQYALYAETLLFISNFIRWKIAKANNNEEDMRIAAESMNFNTMEDYMSSFDSIKHDVLGYIDECVNDSTIKSEEIQKLKVDTEERFKIMEKRINQTSKVLIGNVTTYFRILPDGESEVYVDLPRKVATGK